MNNQSMSERSALYWTLDTCGNLKSNWRQHIFHISCNTISSIDQPTIASII